MQNQEQHTPDCCAHHQQPPQPNNPNLNPVHTPKSHTLNPTTLLHLLVPHEQQARL